MPMSMTAMTTAIENFSNVVVYDNGNWAFLNFQIPLPWTATVELFQMQLGLAVLLAGNHFLHMPKLKHQ